MSESPISALVSPPADETASVTRQLAHHIFVIFFNKLQAVTCSLHEDKPITFPRSFVFKGLPPRVANRHLYSSCNFRRGVTLAVPRATLPATALRGPSSLWDRE
jgi:hypothetical protein